MASWTTPRTANVGDLFTAAWYNAEIKNDEVWAHDTLLSVGASFPASPLTGQRHLFVSGTSRAKFAYDGTNWLSEDATLQLIRGAAGGVGEALTFNPSSGAQADFGSMIEPTINVSDYMTAGMTLQGRLDSVMDDGGAGKTVTLGLAVTTFVTAGSATGRTRITATALTGLGWRSGAWADMLTGAYQGARIGLYGSWTPGGGSPGITVLEAIAQVRFKK